MFRSTDGSRRLKRPSPAMGVACLALFTGLGGVGYAASTIGSAEIKNNSIRSVDIKSKEVKNADLANNAVTSAKVRDGVLVAKDFKASERAALQGPAGARGANGANGAPGAKGDKGDAGAVGAAGPSSFMGRSDDLTDGLLATRFLFANAVGEGTVAAGDRTMVTGNDPLVATGLIVKLTAPPSADESRAFALRVNGVNTALNCSVADLAVTCTDTGPVAIPANAEVAISMQNIGTPTAADGIYAITLARP